MLIELHRDDFQPAATLGTMSIDGVPQCQTLEDTDRRLETGGKKVYGQTAIPRGLYQVVVDYSPRFRRDLPRLLDVPQFIGIRIHPGNFATDTEGCILVGRRRDGAGILDSRAAFDPLLERIRAALKGGQTVRIRIS